MSVSNFRKQFGAFTPQGEADYFKACAEIRAESKLDKSPYSNVFRLHCVDGYIDFRLTRSTYDSDEKVARYFGIPLSEVNGYSTGKKKDVLYDWLKSQGIMVYNVG